MGVVRQASQQGRDKSWTWKDSQRSERIVRDRLLGLVAGQWVVSMPAKGHWVYIQVPPLQCCVAPGTAHRLSSPQPSCLLNAATGLHEMLQPSSQTRSQTTDVHSFAVPSNRLTSQIRRGVKKKNATKHFSTT